MHHNYLVQGLLNKANRFVVILTVLLFSSAISFGQLSVNCSNTPVSCFNGTNGTATAAPIGGQAPYTYLWSNGSTTATTTGLVSGPFTVTVTDLNSNTASCATFVSQPNALNISAVVTDLQCHGDTDGEIELSVIEGTPGYTYSWSNSATTDIISNLAGGTYTVTVTDANLCTASATFIVNEPTAINITEILTNVSCNSGSDGAIDISATGGTGTYTYLWEDFSVDEDRTDLTAGTYTVNVTDGNNCLATASFTVTEPPALSLTETHTSISCFGDADGSIDVTVTGGSVPYIYVWNDGNSNEDRTGLSGGTYTIVVIDNCFNPQSLVITIDEPDEMEVSAIITNLQCNGDTDGEIDISLIGGTAPFSYLWSNSSTSEDVFGLIAGTYTVTVTDAGSCSLTSSFTISQPVALSVTSLITPVSCNGGADGAIDITVSGGTAPYDYLWEDFTIDEDRTSLSAGTYTVVVTDDNGCTISSSFIVVEPLPLGVTETHVDASCSGSPTGSIDVTVSNGSAPYLFFWNDGNSNEDRTGLSAGTYTVTVIDNCFNAQGLTVTITGSTEILISAIITSLQCNGDGDGEIDVTVTGGTAPLTYLWSNNSTTEDLVGLNGGTYTVTVSDASNCSASQSFVVNEPLALTISAITTNLNCNGAANGAVNITVSGGTSPYSYEWEDLSTDEDRSGLSGGTYTVEVTDANGCTTSQSYMVTEPLALSISETHVSLLCFGTANGSINVTATNGTLPYTYQWNDSSTDEDRSGLSGGTYTVIVTDSCLSQQALVINISEPEELLATGIITNLQCNGDIDGEIDLTISGGTTPFTFNWSNGATTEDIIGLGAGTFTITVTDLNNCSTTGTFTIIDPPAISITSSVTDVLCNGAATGAIDITITGGTAPYEYLWEDFSTDEDRIGLVAGTYTVTVSDLNNCSTSSSFTITEGNELLLEVVVQDLFCFGDNDGAIDLNVTGGLTPYTYSWSEGSTTQDISSLTAGTYTVIVTDNNGCSITGSYDVIQPSQIVINGVAGNITCNGFANGTINLTTSGGTGSYTYFWSDFSTDASRSLLDAGTYTVTVFDANNCSATATFEISEPDELLLEAIVQDLFCFGDNDGSIDLTVSGGTAPFSYSWSTSQTTQDISNLGSGTYTVNVTDANGCIISDSYTVNQPAQLSVSGVFVNVSCFGFANGSIDITATGGTGPYSFIWSDFSTDEDRSTLDPGVYTVSVFDENGCTVSTTFNITEPDELLVEAVVQNLFCFGDDDGVISLSVSGGTSPYVYNWSSGQTTQNISGLVAGTYTVTVTDINLCVISTSFTVTQPAIISVTGIVGNVTCNGFSNGTIDITIVGGTAPYSYQWSDFSTDEDRTSLSTGTYTVIVFDLNNCSATESFVIAEADEILVQGIVQNLFCFGDNDGSVSIQVSGGTAPYSFSWSNGETTQDINALVASTYTVIVTDANGCVNSQTYVVTEPAQLTIAALTSNITCNGFANGSINITVGGGTAPFSYLWSDFSTDEDLTGLNAGTYTVTVYDLNNCIATETYTITEPDEMFLQTIVQNLLCSGDNDGSIDVAPVGGTSPYSYNWSNLETTSILSGLSAGTYTVTVTDFNGCIISETYSITEPTLLSVTGVVSGSSCTGTGNGSIDITATGGTLPYSYLWSDFSTDEDRSGLVSGTYTVTVFDENNCSATASFLISESDPIEITATITDLQCNGDADGEIDITVSGGTQPFSYLWSDNSTTEDLTGLSGGIYTVTVTDFNNCSATASFTVNEPTAIQVSQAITNVSCFDGTNGAIDITASGGSPQYSYVWEDFSTDEDRSGLSAGTYTVIISDLNSCTSSFSFTVTQPSTALTATATSTNASCNTCPDGTVSIVSVSGGTPQYSYTDLTGLLPGNYCITVTDANQCTTSACATVSGCNISATCSVIQNESCIGSNDGQISVSVSNGSAPFTYVWSTSPVQSTPVATGLGAGTYTVTVTDEFGCSTTCSSTIATGNLLLVTETHIDILCNGSSTGSINITSTGSSPFNYIWNDGNTNEDRSGLAASDYTVTVTDFCGATQSITITLNENDEILIAYNVTDLQCNGEQNGEIDLTVTGGVAPYTYVWEDLSTNEDRTGLNGGTYTVTVTDGAGCVQTASYNVFEPTAISIAETHVNAGCNGGTTGSIDITATGGTSPYTYVWDDFSTDEDRSGLGAGTYTVIVTDNNSCSTTLSITLINPLPLSAGETHVDILCNGGATGSIDVTPNNGTGPYSYIWNDGNTNEDRSGLAAGDYTVTVTDFCGASQSITITLNENDEILIAYNVTDLQCNGEQNGEIDLTVTGGVAPYTYVWEDLSTNEDRTGLNGGTYTVTVTDGAGCVQTASYNVFEPTAISIAETHVNAGCNGGTTGSIDITATGGTSPYTYVWDDFSTDEDRSGLGAGTYTVIVTDNNSCSTTLSITLINPLPLSAGETHVDILCNGGATGSIDVTPNNGTGPYSYIWNDGNTNEDRSGLAAGDYTVTVTDFCGASQSITITLNENDEILIAYNVTDLQCNGEQNGEIDLTLTGGVAPYTYVWEDLSTNEDRTGLNGGTYTVTVTDGAGCVQTASYNVFEPTAISIAETHVNAGCNGGTTGSIDITATGGTSPYTYVWDDFSTDEDRSGLGAGTYTVIVTDNNSCSTTLSITLINPLPLSAGETHVDILCNGGATGSIDVTPNNGTGPYSYIWNDGNTNEDRSGLTAGDYTVTVTDFCGATQSITITLNENDEIQIAYNVTDLQCNGEQNGEIDLTVTGGVAPYTYVWEDLSTNEDRTGLNGGTYTVTVTDGAGCVQTASYNVFEPTAISIASNVLNVSCFGDNNGSIDITVSGGTIPYSYVWEDFSTDEDRSGLSAGTYTVTVTDFNSCSGSQSFTITAPQAALTVECFHTNVVCFEETNGTASVTPSGGTPGYTYLWTGGQTTQTATGLSAGVYTVIVTDANGCSQTCSSEIFSPQAPLVATAVASNASCNLCADGSLTITSVIGGVAPYTYTDLTNLLPGVYCITVTDAYGCTVTVCDTVLGCNMVATCSVVSEPSCFGYSNGSVTVSQDLGVAPITYLWSTNPVQTTQTATGLAIGTYTVLVTDSFGCSATCSLTLNQPEALVDNPVIDSLSCAGAQDATITSVPTGGTPGYTYLWNTGSTDATISGLPAGTYTIIVTDLNGCTVSSVIDIINIGTFDVSIDNIITTCYDHATGAIYITPTGGTAPYSYVWSNGSTDQNLVNAPAGTYTVTVSDEHGCNIQVSATINSNSQLIVGTSQTNVMCNTGFDGTATVYVSGSVPGYSYLWDNGDTTQTGFNFAAGTHCVTITDAAGCDTTMCFLITEPTMINATFNIVDVTCYGQASGSATVNPFGGTPYTIGAPYIYSWNTIPTQTSQTATGLIAGTYVCHVTDSLGCAEDVVLTVIEPDSMYLNFSVVDNTCPSGTSGDIVISVVGGTPGFIYQWSNGETLNQISDLVSGTYTVIVTDANGCSLTQSFTVVEPPAFNFSLTPFNVSCNGDSTGTIVASVSGGTGSLSYLWNSNPAQTTSTATGLPAGDYTLIVTDASGCTASSSITITEPPALVVTETITDLSCNGSNDGSIVLSIDGGVSPYSILWSNGNTTSSITTLAAGTYTVTITDANLCVHTLTYTVNEPIAIVVSGNVNNVSCNGSANGVITLLVSGGTSPYTYLWNNGSTDQNQTGLIAGIYTVIVTDATNCSVTASFTVSEPAPLGCLCNSSVTNVSCFGGSNGSITAITTGGTGPFTYSWRQISPVVTGVIGTTQTISGLTAGTYEVTITDANGCSHVGLATVTEPPLLIVTGAATNVLCNGGNNGQVITVATGGNPPYSYSWNTSPVQTNSIATGLTAGSYIIIVTDNKGCTASATFTITEPAALLVNITKTNVNCNGGTNGSATANATGGKPPYQYQWSNGKTTKKVTGLKAGTYTVTVTDANGCTKTGVIIIGQPAKINALYVVTNILCNGGSNGAIDVTVSGGNPGYTYWWSNGATTQDLVGITAGIYSLTITDTKSCKRTATITVSQPAALALTITKKNVTCNGGNTGKATASVTGGVVPFHYLWSNGKTTAVANNLTAGTYTVTVTDKKGCTLTGSVVINQPAALTCNAIVIQNVNCFGGNNGQISVSAAGGVAPYTYFWNTSPPASTSFVNNVIAGTYVVLVTDKNGCTSSCAVTVTQPAAISLSMSSTNVNCNGGNNGTASVLASGGNGTYTYLWTTQPAETTSSVSNLTAGIYYVTVTDGNNCTNSASVTITQPTSLTLTATNSNIQCNGGTSTITAIASGGSGPYTYTLTPGPVSNGTGVFPGLSAGSYTVSVSDEHSCTASVNVLISEPSILSMSPVTGTDILCFGGATGTATAGTLTGGTPPYSYSWNTVPAQGTVTVYGLTAGAYTVVVTDFHGCTISGSITLTQPLTALSASVINTVNIPCNGGGNGSATVSASGGTGPYTYLWSNGQTSATATNLIAGGYLVTVTDSNGCQVQTGTTILEAGLLELDVNYTDATCYGSATGTITATASLGSLPYSFTVGGTTNSTGIFTGLVAGNYTVYVTDAGGCMDSISITIMQPGSMIINSNLTNVTCNGGANGTATVFAGAGNAPYTYAWSDGQSTQMATGLAAGTYTATVTDSHGCTITTSVVIAEPAAIALAQTQNDVDCFGATSGTATVTASGGTMPYFYSWSNGQATATAYNLAAGTYTVTVTDYYGCTKTATFIITQNPAIVVTPTQGAINCFGGTTAISVSVSGGFGTYSYSWNHDAGNTTNSAVVGAGVYSLVVTGGKGCTSLATFVVTQPAELLLVANGYHTSCNGIPDGSVIAVASGGTGVYHYVLGNDTNTTGVFAGLAGGNYTVNVYDANGCTNSATTVVVEPASLSVSISQTNTTCGNNNGTANANPNGGTPPYTYSWNSGQTSSNVIGLIAGIYTVTVTDANGCSASATVGINGSTPVVCSTSVTDATCAGYSNGTATVAPIGGSGIYTYLWNTAPVQTTATATGLSIGTYVVTVTDDLGCTSTCFANVGEPIMLTYTTTQINVNCNGSASGAATINANGGTPSYTYLWSTGETTQTISGLVAGYYYFTVYDSHNCSVTGALTITTAPALSCNTTSTAANCNLATGTATDNVAGGTPPYAYQWNNGQSGLTATGLLAGTYTVTATDANGCSTVCTVVVQQAGAVSYGLLVTNATCNGGTGTITISNLNGGIAPYTYLWSNGSTNANPGLLLAGVYTVTISDVTGCPTIKSDTVKEPAAIVIAGSQTNVSCNGLSDGTISVSASGGSQPYSYLWSNSQNSQVINGLAAGTYTVTVTDIYGCSSTSSFNVSQPDALDTVSTSATIASCGQSNGSATVNMTGGSTPYSYSWLTAPVQTTSTATGLGAGNVLVIVTDAHGCSLTLSVAVPSQTGIGLSLVSPTYAGGNNVRCNGGSDGSINLTVSGVGPFTYNWSNGSTTEDQFGLSAGTYTVTVSSGGCTASSTIVLTEPSALSLAMSSVNVTCFGGANGTATVAVSGGASPYSYMWSNGQITSTAVGLVGGTYTVTVNDANGCTLSSSVNVTTPATALSASAVYNQPTCNGSADGNIDLTVTGGTGPYSYYWIDGAVTEDRFNVGANSWTVTVTDANGCNVSICIVLVNPTPIVVSIAKNDVNCNGGATGSANINVSGGQSPYTYIWNNGAIGTSITNLIAGTYTVTVTDSKGCSSVNTVVITQPAVLSIVTSKTDVTVFGGNNGTATATVSGGTGPYIYSWNSVPVQTTATATGLTAGSYTVSVIDSRSCVQIATVIISQPNYLCNPATRPWRTESIVTWAQTPNGVPSQAGQYLANHFASVFPSGVVVGGGCIGGKTVTLTSVTAVRNFLNGQPNTIANPLTINYTNPTSGTLANKLAAQMVALTLNVQFDLNDASWAATNTVPLSSTLITGMTGTGTVFNGMTVGAFITQANKKLGGCAAVPSASAQAYADAAEAINLAYLNGAPVNTTLLSCPSGVNRVEPDETKAPSLQVDLYPNPTNGIMNLNFEANEDGKLVVQIYDAIGQQVWMTQENAFAGTNQRTYDLSSLSRGIYMVHVTLNGQTVTLKIVMN